MPRRVPRQVRTLAAQQFGTGVAPPSPISLLPSPSRPCARAAREILGGHPFSFRPCVRALASGTADSSEGGRADASSETGNWTDRVAVRMGSSVGIDLLEIDRLERALARRPRLASRLFTDTELAYAHSRPRPVMHLAARFCAKEAVVKALALEVWNPHDVEVVREGDGAPRGAAVGPRRGARVRARRLGGDLDDPHARHGGRCRRGGAVTTPRWLEPLPDAALMRATDAWAIETKGIPARQLMERAGEGLARAVGKHAPAGRIAVVCGKGNNGGDGLVAARLLRQAGRDVDVLAVWPPEWMGEDAQAQVKALPGPPPAPFHPDRLEKAHAIVDAVLGTGFEGAPRDPADAVILAMNAARARGDRGRRPERRQRLDRRGGGLGRARRRHRDVPPGQAGAVDPPRQGARRRGRGGRHRDPDRRARRGRDRADRRRRAVRHAAAHRGLDEVLLRQRLHHRRLARADRRAVDGRAGRDARRSGLRDGRRARNPSSSRSR